MADVAPFPWAMIMRFGLGTLRLPPDDFWRSTPREMAAALSAFSSGGLAPMERSNFEALMKRYPDHNARRGERNE